MFPAAPKHKSPPFQIILLIKKPPPPSSSSSSSFPFYQTIGKPTHLQYFSLTLLCTDTSKENHTVLSHLQVDKLLTFIPIMPFIFLAKALFTHEL
jgi:hypothetical protein